MNIYICHFSRLAVNCPSADYYLMDPMSIFIGSSLALSALGYSINHSLMNEDLNRCHNIYLFSPKFDNGTNRIFFDIPEVPGDWEWEKHFPVLNEDTVGDLFTKLMTSPPNNLFIDSAFDREMWESPFGRKFMDGIFKLAEKR